MFLCSRIIRVPELAVFHRRDRSTYVLKKQSAVQTLVADMSGFASYRALAEIFNHESPCATFSFSEAEEQSFGNHFHHYFTQRLALAEMSIARIHGLMASISHLDPDLKSAMQSIDDAFGISCAWNLISSGASIAQEPSQSDLSTWLHGLHRILYTGTSDLDCMEFTRQVREKLASQSLALRGRLTPSTDLIGIGGEGVTFKIDGCAMKVMDMLPMRAEPDAIQRMQSLLDDPKVKNAFSLSWVAPSCRPVSGHQSLILQRPLIDGQQYAGGLGPALVSLLLSLRRAGINCRNISPANLMVEFDVHTGKETLHLIDFGLDIVFHSDSGMF